MIDIPQACKQYFNEIKASLSTVLPNRWRLVQRVLSDMVFDGFPLVNRETPNGQMVAEYTIHIHVAPEGLEDSTMLTFPLCVSGEVAWCRP